MTDKELPVEQSPVAIVRTHKTGGNVGIAKHVHPYGDTDLNELPEGTLLYTHPAPQISDERINNMFRAYFGVTGNITDHWLSFIHAVLKEAQRHE